MWWYQVCINAMVLSVHKCGGAKLCINVVVLNVHKCGGPKCA
jgi:hypothetical protein